MFLWPERRERGRSAEQVSGGRSPSGSPTTSLWTLTRRTNDCCDKHFYNPICITHELRGPLGETAEHKRQNTVCLCERVTTWQLPTPRTKLMYNSRNLLHKVSLIRIFSDLCTAVSA